MSTIIQKSINYWKLHGTKKFLAKVYQTINLTRKHPIAAINNKIYLDTFYPNTKKSTEFVPKSSNNHKQSFDIKMIAYYLPQFHPFTENDQWWGKGFTEWTNVTKAKPQFAGHYQPHLPVELGFYDLRLTSEIMTEQIALAKLYGIHGFCFYHYWFGGKRLMELPVNNFLKDKNLDINFCLCWANENWSRRWDGLDNDILIAQNHSPEDDEAFLEDILPALKDPRYITIDEKPVLLLYNPALLPDAKETGKRWRKLAISHGLKGLYLVSVNSFNNSNPSQYEFDACVEFPPHQVDVKRVNQEQTILNPEYQGHIYDYSSLPIDFGKKENQDYTEFKCVMPSWDNEARKPSKGHSFIHSSPQKYAEWLFNAAKITQKKRPEERLLFVNAWNEWAEGAHLEPCIKYGYAFLHATYAVLSNLQNSENPLINQLNNSFSPKHESAIILHLFYEDLIDDLFQQYLVNLSQDVDLIITISSNISDEGLKKIHSYFNNTYFIVVKNRGRDILPFLTALKMAQQFHYKYICKIHSKKSLHRIDGQQWRNQLFTSLIPSLEYVQKIEQLFKEEQKIGMIVNKDIMMNLDNEEIYAGNILWLNKLLQKLNRSDLVKNYKISFPAGSMYWCKLDAISTLLNEDFINENDFEFEAGQLDGTLAHAIERLMGLLVEEKGYIIKKLN